MIKSLRARLQLWYGLVLTIAVAGFAVILYNRALANTFDQIDANLIAGAEYLDAALRTVPVPLLEVRGADGRPGGEKKGRPDMKGPPDRDKGKGKFLPPGMDGRPRFQPERRLDELFLPSTMNITPDEPNRQYFAIWRADGKVVKIDGGRDEITPEVPGQLPDSATIFDRGNFREARRNGPLGTRIVVGVPVEHERAGLRAFAWRLSGIGIGVVGIGLFGGWLVSSRVVKPISDMAATAAKISATNLSERIDATHVDTELAGLANVLNEAFERLQSSFNRQAQFTADASHELRTPLAVIRSHADWALNKPRSTEEYQDSLTACRRAAERMTGLVDGLLTLARADARFPGQHRETIQLRDLALREVDLIKPLAAEKRITVDAELEPAEVVADPDGLTRVLHNLLANAVQYCGPGGTIMVRCGSNGRGVKLEVADSGIGISDADRPHVFDRFYRVDKARSREVGGVGLGLAICREIIVAHGGEINCRPNDERGTVFAVTLPRPD